MNTYSKDIDEEFKKFLEAKNRRLTEGDDDDEEEGPDLEEINDAAETLESQVQANQNDAPKADETNDQIAIDTSLQNVPLNQGMKDYQITFKDGNWEVFNNSPTEYSRKVTLIRQTALPLVEKALIELLGNSESYIRSEFEASSKMDTDTVKIEINMRYFVQRWMVVNAPAESVAEDRNFIIKTLGMAPELTLKNVIIDTNTGSLVVSISV